MKALLEQKAKAIAAAVVSALAAYLLTALTTGTAATLHGLEVAGGTAALAFLGVHSAPKNKRRDAGFIAANVLLVWLLVAIAVIVLVLLIQHHVHIH